MRRVLVLSGLVSALFLAVFLEPPASVQAQAMCSTTCSSGATLTCCPTTRCSTVAGTSVTCDGVVMSCSAVNPWYTCKAACEERRIECFDTCIKCGLCAPQYNNCLNNCGPAPTTNIGC